MSSSSAYPALESAQYNYINKATVLMHDSPYLPATGGLAVSEARFGQAVAILRRYGEWVKIRTVIDQYTGWVEASAVHSTDIDYLEFPDITQAKVIRCRVNIYRTADILPGPMLSLPYETRLEAKPETNLRVSHRWLEVTLPDERVAFVQRGDVELNPKLLSREEMIALAVRLKNNEIPFTMGGTTTFGFDSSGFVQMLYRQMGVFLPRSSKDQFESNHLTPKNLDALESGDLIFFGSYAANVQYVGMYLGNNKFVHCGDSEDMPYLRVSNLSDAAWDGAKWPFRAGKTLANASAERVAS